MAVNQVAIFDKEKSVSLRGVAALCVMLGHILVLYPWYVKRLFPGELWVGLFFFFSGYGLYKSYSTHGQSYLSGFWLKKFKNIYLPFLYAESFTTFCVLLLNSKFTFSEFVLGALGCRLYNSALWYVIELIVVNIVFWCFAKIFKQTQRKVLNLAWFLGYICFLSAGVITGIGTWWYISTSGFLLGLLVCGKDSIVFKCISNSWSYLPCFLFFSLYAFSLYVSHLDNSISVIPVNYVLTALTMILVPLFVFTCAVFFQRIRKVGGVFKYLGIMSLEIYLWHIPVFFLIRQVFNDRFLIVLLTIIFTVIISSLFRVKELKHQFFQIYA